MPVQIFFNSYQKDQFSFSVRLITSDVAASIGHDYTLWSITGAANKCKLVNDMDTLYA